MPVKYTVPNCLLQYLATLNDTDAEEILVWLSNTDLPEIEMLSQIVITHPKVQIGKDTI